MAGSFTQPGDGTMLLDRAGREISYRRIKVEVVSGPDQGKSFVADGGELSIGTADGNDLQLTDPAVSRHHCVVTVVPRGYQLADLGSTNGTTVAGIGVERALVRPGVVVELGQTRLRFDIGDDRVREPLAEEERWGRALGRSPAMRRIFALLPRLAGSDTSLLLEGETGTGKSLLAEVIHDASSRRAGPFVVVDCGAIPPTLIESELFGHERGAFTGATATRRGVFEAAAAGTVFLDEIGELPLGIQAKLLRAVEAREVLRLGSTKPIAIAVRFVAATNRELASEVAAGRFRRDLYFRLDGVTLRIPPLRDRIDRIAPLALRFLAAARPRRPAHATPALLAALAAYDWPGNVRELKAVIERAVLLAGGGDLEPKHLAFAPRSREPEREREREPERASEPVAAAGSVEGLGFLTAEQRADRAKILDALDRSAGNQTRAAKLLEISRTTLVNKLALYRIPRPRPR